MSTWQAVLARRARADAAAQRDRAVNHLRQAREAVDQMLTEVGQETLSRVPRMEPVRRALLEKALSFYEKFLFQEGDDPAIRLEAGRAYRRVGEIRAMLGQNDRACEALRSSIEVLGGLMASHPSDLDCRRELAKSHSNLAGSLFKIGRRPEAEAEYRHVIDLCKEILERYSSDPDDRLRWAEAQGLLGTFFIFTGHLGDAKEIERQAREVLERLVDDFPNEPRYQSAFGACLNDSGIVALDQKDFAAARTLFEQAYTHQRTALKADQQNLRYRCFARNHQEMLAVALIQLGQGSEAEKLFRECVSIGASIASDFPLVPDYREDLAGTYGNLATLLIGKGASHREETAHVFDEAGKLFQSLAAEYPSVPRYRVGLAAARNNLGHVFRDAGRFKDAEQSYRKAAELVGALVAADPTNRAFKQSLANHQENLAVLLVLNPNTDVDDPQEGVRLMKEATKLMPEKASLWLLLAQCHFRLGNWKACIDAVQTSAQTGGNGKLNPNEKFVMAMAHWRLGERDAGLALFNEAAAEMDKVDPRDEKSVRSRAQAAALLGVGGTSKPPKEEAVQAK